MLKQQQKREDFAQPRKVSDVQRAFPARIVGTYLPPREWFTEDEVPPAWEEFVSAMFSGSAADVSLLPQEGIDAQTAWDHATMCLGSYEPKHEHKTEGVAWLLWKWFAAAEYVYLPTGQKVTL